MDGKKTQVTIGDRNIQMTVCIPVEYGETTIAWQFMQEFGEKFAELRKMYPNIVRQVDGYVSRADSWDITVTIPEHLEKHFYDFVRDFCQKNSLAMKDPAV